MSTLVIDSSNLLYRIWWINKAKNLSGDGDSQLVFLFLRAFRSYVRKYPTDKIISVWDKKLIYPSTNFRKENSDGEYKATRDKEQSEEVHQYDDIIVSLLDKLGVINMFPGRMEGDDVVAWCSDKREHTTIVSADHDMYQLVQSNTRVYNPVKKIEINFINFKDMVGVDVDDFILYKSLIGDKSDNIPGLKRVGKKTALKMIDDWPAARAKLSEDDIKRVENNIRLIDLRYGVNYYPEEAESYRDQYRVLEESSLDKTEFIESCKDHSLYNILRDPNWTDPFSHRVEEAVISVIEVLGLGNK